MGNFCDWKVCGIVCGNGHFDNNSSCSLYLSVKIKCSIRAWKNLKFVNFYNINTIYEKETGGTQFVNEWNRSTKRRGVIEWKLHRKLAVGLLLLSLRKPNTSLAQASTHLSFRNQWNRSYKFLLQAEDLFHIGPCTVVIIFYSSVHANFFFYLQGILRKIWMGYLKQPSKSWTNHLNCGTYIKILSPNYFFPRGCQ